MNRQNIKNRQSPPINDMFPQMDSKTTNVTRHENIQSIATSCTTGDTSIYTFTEGECNTEEKGKVSGGPLHF